MALLLMVALDPVFPDDDFLLQGLLQDIYAGSAALADALGEYLARHLGGVEVADGLCLHVRLNDPEVRVYSDDGILHAPEDGLQATPVGIELLFPLLALGDVPADRTESRNLSIGTANGGDGIFNGYPDTVFSNDVVNDFIRNACPVNFIISLKDKFGCFFIHIRPEVDADDVFPAPGPPYPTPALFVDVIVPLRSTCPTQSSTSSRIA